MVTYPSSNRSISDVDMSETPETISELALLGALKFARAGDGLPRGQVQQHLLGAPGNGRGTDLPVEALDDAPGALAHNGGAAKDLGRLPGAILESLGGHHLEQRSLRAQPRVRHPRLVLEGHPFVAVVQGLDLPQHLAELPPDHLMFAEFFAEGLSTHGVLEGLGVAQAGEAASAHGDDQPLMVEVQEQIPEACSFLTDEVAHGHHCVVEGDERCAVASVELGFHLANLDARSPPVDEQQGHTLTSRPARPDGQGEEVGHVAAGYPLLLSVDPVMIAFPLGGGSDRGDIGARRGLRDGQRDVPAAGDDVIHDLRLHVRRACKQDRRQRHRVDAALTHGTSGACGSQLVQIDQLVQRVEAALRHDLLRIPALRIFGEAGSGKTAGKGLGVQIHRVDLPLLQPTLQIWHDLLLDELSALPAELHVRGSVVGRGETLVPIRLTARRLVPERLHRRVSSLLRHGGADPTSLAGASPVEAGRVARGSKA
mmetsp:Transcript_83459/g.239730  ORF Transcript_83459/g.239730 Transcript_83459/m.239730 type:complete len:484 (-) Transcript_83459:12-1463(-)